jgi:pimeloyl-ACP methyl ester carboxylesterase
LRPRALGGRRRRHRSTGAAADPATLLEHLDLRGAVVMGHSMAE